MQLMTKGQAKAILARKGYDWSDFVAEFGDKKMYLSVDVYDYVCDLDKDDYWKRDRRNRELQRMNDAARFINSIHDEDDDMAELDLVVRGVKEI